MQDIYGSHAAAIQSRSILMSLLYRVQFSSTILLNRSRKRMDQNIAPATNFMRRLRGNQNLAA